MGSLIGQCLGDALGFVVEGHSAEDCRRYVDDWLRGGRAGAIGRAPFAFGQYTDDSQFARELMQSYRACGGFEPAHYAEAVAAIFTEGRIVGRGRSTEAAALRLAAGTPWQEAGTAPPMAGNGSAMRAGPIGLLFHDDPDALPGAAHDQGRMTHADPRCSAGAAIIAGAVALALRREAVEPDVFVAALLPLAESYDARMARELARMTDWVAMDSAAAGPEIAQAGRGEAPVGRDWDGIAPYVVPSVLWSLYAFLRSPDDYWSTICVAIEVGGDVDTTAAMAGAISGAYNGLDAIPEDLAVRLNDQGTWGYAALLDLARDCHAAKHSP